MAKYRQLYTEFWSDSFVLELTPEEKYFYLYLISNSKTTQCGIYEISKRIIETETGYNRDTVEKLIKRFCDYNKILYCDDTKELMIINWIKYNTPNNVNAIKCVHKELSKVKHKEFLKILFKKCQAAGLDIERIFQNLMTEEASQGNAISAKKPQNPYEVETINVLSRDLQGPYKGLPSNRIRNNKEEVINNKQEISSKEEEAILNENTLTDAKGIKAIIKTFEENVHALSPLEAEKLLGFAAQVSNEVIIMAIEEAVSYNAKTMKYITKVLNNWISSGLKTKREVAAYQKQWANKKSNYINPNVKKGSFCDYEQRSYDFDALERKLLKLEDVSESTED